MPWTHLSLTATHDYWTFTGRLSQLTMYFLLTRPGTKYSFYTIFKSLNRPIIEHTITESDKKKWCQEWKTKHMEIVLANWNCQLWNSEGWRETWSILRGIYDKRVTAEMFTRCANHLKVHPLKLSKKQKQIGHSEKLFHTKRGNIKSKLPGYFITAKSTNNFKNRQDIHFKEHLMLYVTE